MDHGAKSDSGKTATTQGATVKPEGIAQDRQGAVLVLSLARGPVNALNGGMIAALRQALAAAAKDDAVRAVVLAAEGAQFSVGVDISELGRIKGPGLAELCHDVEAMPKPVVAAMQGNALGGGFELILAAHARMAEPGAMLGLPEIALGLIPGAGGTQRLPRLVGAEPALRLMLDGMLLTAAQALAIGLLDQVVEEALVPRAVALALRLAEDAPQRTQDCRNGMRDGRAYQAAVTSARAKAALGRMSAPLRIIDCVEAAQLLPFAQGLAYERAAFEEIATSAEAMGLRHTFLAERRAFMPPAAVLRATPPRLTQVSIWGAGGMSAEVARLALASGLRVVLADPKREVLALALEKIATRMQALVTEGKLAPEARDADWNRLIGRQTAEGLGGELLFTQAEAGPLPAPVGQPVVALGGPGPFSLYPAAEVGQLAEVGAAPEVEPEDQALAMAFARRLGWRVMLVGNCAAGGSVERRLRVCLSRVIASLETRGLARSDIAKALAGFGLGAGAKVRLPVAVGAARDVVPACLAALANEGARMLQEGAARWPAQIDVVATMSGLFPRWEGGPMFLADRQGLMALRADLRRRAETQPDLFTPAPMLDRLIGEGRDFSALNG